MGRPRRFKLLIVALGLATLAAIGYWQYMRPHVYRLAASPDDSWSVTVLRQHLSLILEGVDVIVEVRDGQGRLLRREVIGNEDLWRDVDDMYPVVECTNDAIRVSCPDCSIESPGKEEWVLRKEDAATRPAS